MPDLIPGLGFLAQVAVVLLAFSFMVFVHELGHYLAARLVGVRVERFFVGFDLFGLSISKKIGHTVYGVGALPLGGYCALAGQNDDPRKEVVTGAPDELRSRPLWAQCLVFVSGVLMNFLFGFVLLVWAEMYGIPFVPNVVGDVVPGEPAEVHGLRKGDRILFVDGTRTDTFEDVYGAIAVTPVDQPMRLTVLRPAGDGGERLDLRVRGRQSEARGNLNTIGVVPPVSREVYAVPPDYRDPVLAALLRPGDEIVAVDGEPVPPDEGAALEARLLKWPAETVRLTVRRPGEPADFDVEAPLRTVGRVDFGFRVAVIVDKVTAGAAADDAGVEAGDQIVGIAVDGEPEPRTFRRSKDFTDALAETSLRRVDIGYLRGGREYLATLKPRGMPGDPRHAADEDTLLGVVGRFAASGGGDGEGGTGPAPDAVIGTAAPGGGAARGFVVREVLADGPADGVLEPGDVIVDLANRPLDGATPLRDAVPPAG